MRIKIESDGTPQGTKVFNAETGEKIDGVTRVEWSVGLGDVGKARVEFSLVEIAALGDEFQRFASTQEIRKIHDEDPRNA